MKNKNKNSILLFVVLALTAFLVVLRMLSTVSQPSRAAQPKVNFLMIPKTGLISTGEQKVIAVILQTEDPVNKITGFDFHLSTLGNLQITNISEPLNLDTNDGSIFTKLVKDVAAADSRLSYVILQPDDKLPARVQIQVTVTAGQSQYTNGILKIDGSTAQVVGNVTGNGFSIGTIEQAEFNLGGDITPTIITNPSNTPPAGGLTPTTIPTITRTPTPLPSGFPTLTPTRIPTVTPVQTNRTPTPTIFGQQLPTPTGTGGNSSCPKIASPIQPKPFGLVFTPGETPMSWQPVSGAVKYAIRIDDIGNGWLGYFVMFGDLVDDDVLTNAYSFSFESGHAYRWWVHAISSCGRWSAPLESYVYVPPTTPTNAPALPTPTLPGTTGIPVNSPTPLPPGFPTLTPTPTGYFPSPTPTTSFQNPTPTYTIAPTATPALSPTPPLVDINVNLKLRFQGVVKNSKKEFNKLRVNFTVFKDGKVVSKPAADFTADPTGILLGRITFKGAVGDGYGFAIDTHKHLRRTICRVSPTETDPHGYTCNAGAINLRSGDNNLDFTGITIFAGDVPGVGNYPADGVIDSADLTVLAQHFGNKNTSGKGTNVIIGDYDLNLDGRVDTQDYSLSIFSMLIQRLDDNQFWQ